MDLTAVAVAFCTIVGLVFLGLWLWYDRRDHQRFELQRGRTTFHCIRCDHLYTAPPGTAVCHCPKCGHENARLRF